MTSGGQERRDPGSGPATRRLPPLLSGPGKPPRATSPCSTTFRSLPTRPICAKAQNLNDALLALLPLVGVWRGEGEGHRANGDFRFGQQIIVSHDGGDYLNWEARSWRLDDDGEYDRPDLRETGFWRFVNDPGDHDESQAIELLLAHSAGYVELFYGQPAQPVVLGARHGRAGAQ